MSTGTENIVFNRLFEPGTHWDRWVKYPFYPGYTSVGIVETLGEGVNSLKTGDRVAFRQGHRSHAIVDEARAAIRFPMAFPSTRPSGSRSPRSRSSARARRIIGSAIRRW